MTIRRGEPWGVEVARPSDLVVVGNDRDVVDAVPPVGLSGGDLFRSLGSPASRDPAQRVEIDGIEVVLDDDRRLVGVAHVVVRKNWWRGRVVAVMNVDHLGAWNVAPRAHPNDGILDVVECTAAMSLRDRWAAGSRLASGTHLPHPDIEVVRTPERSWIFDRPHGVWIDGRRVASSRHLTVTCLPDRFTVVF